MPYLIGVDEAGYGPNLGPLVIAATVWQVDDDIDGTDLYKRLRRVVTGSPASAGKKRLCWADSKAIYKNGNGLDQLERGVLTALGLVQRWPGQWRDVWTELGPQCAPLIDDIPWHAGFASQLPFWYDEAPLRDLVPVMSAGLEKAGVRLAGLLARAVFPGEFNALVADCGNKAEALSRTTLDLVAAALDSIGPAPTILYCDKHGGRNQYLPLVQSRFPDDWIEVRVESAPVSRYRFKAEERRVDLGFWEKGERFLPTALASMTAKYLRELAMRPFNDFWCARVPGLQPTAGYPVDSYRFKKQIASAQRDIGLDDTILWRAR